MSDEQHVSPFPQKELGKSWVIVCVHLLKGESKDWNPITNEDGVTEGFLCDHCDMQGPSVVKISNLEPLATESAMALMRERS